MNSEGTSLAICGAAFSANFPPFICHVADRTPSYHQRLLAQLFILKSGSVDHHHKTREHQAGEKMELLSEENHLFLSYHNVCAAFLLMCMSFSYFCAVDLLTGPLILTTLQQLFSMFGSMVSGVWKTAKLRLAVNYVASTTLSKCSLSVPRNTAG